MAGCKFYVIDNLKNAGCQFDYFNDISDAVTRFYEHENVPGKTPVLGVQVGMGSMDLIHGVNGNNVLCRDYRNSANLSEDMRSVLKEINNIVDKFVTDGTVTCEYCSELLLDSALVLVPISKSKDGYDDRYCDGKILKTSFRYGCDAIDEAFVKGHGWVGYQELRTNTGEYCKDGVLSVDALNVIYVLERNRVGVDGRMDVSPADFVKMVDKINKPYTLVAYDTQNYNYQYKDRHDFIVGSYDDVSDAVKAWYDIKTKHSDLKLYVAHLENGRESAVFNGVDDNFEEISYDKAAEMFGFEGEKTVESLIREATATTQAQNNSIGSNNQEKDLVDFDKE